MLTGLYNKTSQVSERLYKNKVNDVKHTWILLKHSIGLR